MAYKTFKRETAWVCLLFLGYIALFGKTEVVEILAWPIFLFVGASFGMDWAGKFTSIGGKNASFTDTTKK